MVRQIDSHSSEALSRGGGGTWIAKAPDAPLATRPRVTPDQGPPVFAILRASLGLPLDDPRWWSACPEGELLVPMVSFAAPTLSLLERTLAGLRAWGTAPAAESHRSA